MLYCSKSRRGGKDKNFQRGHYIFIYLFYLLEICIPLPWAQHTIIPRKERRRKEQRKNGLGQKVKLSTPTRAIDACMWEEEKNRKQKEEQEWAPNPATLNHFLFIFLFFSYLLFIPYERINCPI